MLPHNGLQSPIQGSIRRVRRGASLPLLGGERLEIGAAAIGEDNAKSAHVVDRFPVDDGASAGGVVADHSAQVGPAPGRYVRPELKIVRTDEAIEGIEHNTRLDACDAADRIDVEHVVEILAAIENDTR